MKDLKKHTSVFFGLVRAGLWENEWPEMQVDRFADWNEIYKVACEQAVVGLAAAGIEHVANPKIPQEIALTFIGAALQLEQRNNAMNEFVAKTIACLRENDIYALLVKGQGLAQCYERPLWSACGDIDLLLSKKTIRKLSLV